MSASVFCAPGSKLGSGSRPTDVGRERSGMLGAAAALWKRATHQGVLSFRGRTLLALGESYGTAGQIGKSVEAVKRLAQLNPALHLDIRCIAGGGLEAAASSTATLRRNSVDVCIVFVDQTHTAVRLTTEDAARSAKACFKTILRIARRVIVVSTPAGNMEKEIGCSEGKMDLLAGPGRKVASAFDLLCQELNIEHICLCSEVGSVTDQRLGSDNFSAFGFSPLRDQSAMWTACMLQRSSIAQLVFH